MILKSKNNNFTNIKYPFQQKKKIDIDKIVVSKNVSFGKNRFKYFIGYKAVKKIRPSCKFLPKMSAYKRGFDGTKYLNVFFYKR